MAEGGRFPWKVQKIFSRGPSADYSGISNPLPKPPAGMKWQQDRETRDWRLIPEAEQQENIPNAGVVKQLGMQVDTVPEMDITGSTTPAGEEEWEVLSDGKVSAHSASNNSACIFVSKAGSVRSIGSMEGHGNSSLQSHSSATTLSVPYKIQRTHSNSTIDSVEQNLGPSGKGVLGVDYVEHIILPTDTMQGICLAYKINATRLRQANHFSGNSLVLAPKKLVIPISKKALRAGYIRVQDTDAKEFKLHAFLAEFPDLSLAEARAYLELADWVLKDAIQSGKEDNEWEREIDATSLRSGEIRITSNGLSMKTQGAGIRNQTTASSNSQPAAVTPTKDNRHVQPQQSLKQMGMQLFSKPVTYNSIPEIATKSVKAHDIYKAGTQHGHLGVELQPLVKQSPPSSGANV